MMVRTAKHKMFHTSLFCIADTVFHTLAVNILTTWSLSRKYYERQLNASHSLQASACVSPLAVGILIKGMFFVPAAGVEQT